MVLIVVVVAAAALALGRLQTPEPEGLDRVLPTIAAALLLGWVTVATVAQVALTGVHLGAPDEGGLAQAAGIVALVAAAAIVLDVTLRLRTAAGPFAAAAAWGLLAVALADPPTPVRLAAFVAVGIVVVGVLVQVWRTRRLVRTSWAEQWRRERAALSRGRRRPLVEAVGVEHGERARGSARPCPPASAPG